MSDTEYGNLILNRKVNQAINIVIPDGMDAATITVEVKKVYVGDHKGNEFEGGEEYVALHVRAPKSPIKVPVVRRELTTRPYFKDDDK